MNIKEKEVLKIEEDFKDTREFDSFKMKKSLKAL